MVVKSVAFVLHELQLSKKQVKLLNIENTILREAAEKKEKEKTNFLAEIAKLQNQLKINRHELEETTQELYALKNLFENDNGEPGLNETPLCMF
jgi:predicted  nucleic acid-binding Zn-ribbon protein